MITYNKDQEYTLKVANTDNEVKEIKYTPDKDMSKPEMIMALKAKYKNFFKLIENKRIKADDLKIGDIYIDLSHNLQRVIDRPMPEKDLGITRKQLTKMFMPNRKNIKGTKWELEKIRPATKEDFENYPLIESKLLDRKDRIKTEATLTDSVDTRKLPKLPDKLYKAVQQIKINYDENIYNEDGDEFAGTSDSYANENLDDELGQLVYLYPTDEMKIYMWDNFDTTTKEAKKETEDFIFNKLKEAIVTNTLSKYKKGSSKKTEEYFVCSRCLRGIDLDYNVEDYVIDPKTGEEMCRNCAEEAGIITDDELDENIEIENHRQKKLDELQSDIRYDFEEAYKDWGNEVSKTKSGFVNEYMSEFCNDFDEVNWRKYIVAIPEVDKIYEENKDIEDWEISEDVKTKLYELITDYVQNYLKGVYNKVEESKNTINEKSLSDFLDNIDNAWSLDTTQTKNNGTKVYVVRKLANSKYTAEDIKNKIETEFNLNGDITSNNKEIWLSDKKVENKSTEGNSVIVISYGKGTRFPNRKIAIDYYKECIAGTDPEGAENYSYQNILDMLVSTDEPVVYDWDDKTEYDWWVQKGKPTEDISDELLKAHLGESKNMKKEDLSDKDMKELDEYTETEIRKMYDKYCSENTNKKSFEEWQKENIDSALINELEYEFFSNRKKTEDLDINNNGFVDQKLNNVLTYIGDGHDIADNVYDVEVFFALIDEPDTSDNYDLYIQGLSNTLKVVDAFDENDVNIIVNLTDYVTTNKAVLLDLFEVNGETDEEIMEDLVCRVMPLVISGYTTDSVYKILLNTVN